MVALTLARLKDTSVALEQRIREVDAMGRKGDPDSIRALMAAGIAPIYVNRYAVESLGQCRGPEIRAYLEARLTDPDALIVCAAIRALARSAEANGIPAIAATLQNNRVRPDGHERMVCTAAATALGQIAHPSAVPALIRELERSETGGINPEYGSTVIAALRASGTSEGRSAMGAYAERLATRLPEDPMARTYIQSKIDEARAAAEGR